MISIKRAKTILACYGGHPSAWPEQERLALQQLLQKSDNLKVLQKEALELDTFMGFSQYKMFSTLDDSITNHCAEQILQNLAERNPAFEAKEQSFTQRWRKTFLDSLKIQQPVFLLSSVVLVSTIIISGLLIAHHRPADKLSLADYMALYVDETAETNMTENPLELIAFLEPQIIEDYN